MVSLNHKKTNKERAIKRIVNKYEREDYDANKNSKELLEKELSLSIDKNPNINLNAE